MTNTNRIWDFIGSCVDYEGYLPSWHEIAEFLETEGINIDAFDLIDSVVENYLSVHELDNVKNYYLGECV